VQGVLAAAPFAIGPANPGNTRVYKDVLRHAETMFDTIREALLAYGVSNCVRASLLQPMTSISMKQVGSFTSTLWTLVG
jgi:hypothetical protein